MVDRGVVLAVRCWIWCSTLLMVYMPSLSVRRIYRDQAVGQASIVPIFLVLANSHVWMLYGYLGKTWFPSFPVFLIGDVVSVVYLFVYWKYSSDRRQVARSIGLLFTWLALPTLYVVVASAGLTGQTRVEVWRTQGLCFCDVTVVAVHTLMLKKLVRAFKQRSAATLEPQSLAVTTFNTFGWFTFGQVTYNWIIAGPQVFVIALHVAAWSMYVVFTRRTRPETTEEGSTTGSVNFLPKFDLEGGSKAPTVPNSPEYQALYSPLEPLH